MEENKRDFKGVWIPKEIWLDKRLNALDKVILTEIDSLDSSERGCFASNKHIANFCQCSETKVSTSISKLIEYGYLYVQKFDGRQRELKSRLSKFERQSFKDCEADSQNLKESNIDNNTSNNTYNISPISPKRDMTDYNAVIEAYNDTCYSLPSVKTLNDGRKRAIRKLYRNYSMEQINEVFLKAQCSDFLSGKSGKWNATFDWLIKDSNFIKVLEGNYDNKVATASRIDWMDDAL